MCSSPKVPKIKAPSSRDLPEIQPLPPPAPLPAPQQAAAAPVMAPPPAVVYTPPPPPLAPVELEKQAPPPVSAQNAEDVPIVKRRKTKRGELQQANQGAGALTIERNATTALGQGSGNTGSSGLNIPN